MVPFIERGSGNRGVFPKLCSEVELGARLRAVSPESVPFTSVPSVSHIYHDPAWVVLRTCSWRCFPNNLRGSQSPTPPTWIGGIPVPGPGTEPNQHPSPSAPSLPDLTLAGRTASCASSDRVRRPHPPVSGQEPLSAGASVRDAGQKGLLGLTPLLQARETTPEKHSLSPRPLLEGGKDWLQD